MRSDSGLYSSFVSGGATDRATMISFALRCRTARYSTFIWRRWPPIIDADGSIGGRHLEVAEVVSRTAAYLVFPPEPDRQQTAPELL